MLIRTVKCCLLLLMQALALPASAQSLGEELILSRLGDPVEVEIEVRDWQGADLKQVQILNASEPQYAAFNLTYLPILDALSFNLVGPNRAGEVKILVSSREPVSEPFMDLLLVLRWPQGSSLREYVLLFDPPSPEFEQQEPRVSATAPAPVVPASVTPPSTPVVAPVPPQQNMAPPPRAELPGVRTQAAIEVEPVRPIPSTAEAVDQESVVEAAVAEEPLVATPVDGELAIENGRRQYQVRSGETLWDIARQFNPAGVSENLYQFLISAHGMNRNAFINGNISMLKVGAVLSIPVERDIAAINPSTAQELFEQLWGPDVPGNVAEAPAFTPLNEPLQEAAEPAVEPEPDLPPGTERPTVMAESGLLSSAATSVMVAVAVDEPEPVQPGELSAATVIEEPAVQRGEDLAPPPAPVPAIQVVPQRVGPEPTQAVGAQANPYLAGITQSATTVRDMLNSRRQRMADLEQQILGMQQQMQQAAQLAAGLTQGLDQGRQQRSDETQDILLLAGLAAALLLALGVTVKLGLQWNREAQMRVQAQRAARVRNQASPRKTTNTPKPAVTSQQMDVREVLDFLRVEPTFPEEPTAPNSGKKAG